jgi:hypothetical protein
VSDVNQAVITTRYQLTVDDFMLATPHVQVGLYSQMSPEVQQKLISALGETWDLVLSTWERLGLVDLEKP